MGCSSARRIQSSSPSSASWHKQQTRPFASFKRPRARDSGRQWLGGDEARSGPAIERITASSPALLEPFAELNRDKSYAEQVKPSNFLLSAHVAPFGLPPGVNGSRFRLIAPYKSDPRKWLTLPWIDRYSGKSYRITTAQSLYATSAVRVTTYRDVLDQYRNHAEAKSLAPDGGLCRGTTTGRLQRRPVMAQWVTHVGKESNKLKEVEAGLVHDPEEVYTEYVDARRDLD